MEYTIRSKIYGSILWVATIAFLLDDTLAYYLAIIPGELDFGLIDHLAFFVSFVGKIATTACLVLKKGPIKVAVFITLVPIIVYGLYCGLVFPISEETGFGSDSAINLGVAFLATSFIVATNIFIVQNSKN